ncbi:ATP-dependent helicase [bacterium]|nr:ATP-dependent helicase [bacterium]
MELAPTKEQSRVYDFVKYESGHGIIDAVAGSGKTTTIIESMRHIKPDVKVLFCAFNKSIQREIAKRVEKIGSRNVSVKTMHSLGLALFNLQSRVRHNHNDRKYSQIFDRIVKNSNSTIYNGFQQLLNIRNVDPTSQEPSAKEYIKLLANEYRFNILDITDKYRLTLCGPNLEDFESLILHFNIFNDVARERQGFKQELELYHRCILEILDLGNTAAITKREIDFVDMIYQADQLRIIPERKFDMVFIDECQDLSKAQFKIALKYVKQNGRILAVGDPSQSIYGFAGADISSFDNIRNKLPNVTNLKLSYCFRCPNTVIDLAKNYRDDITPFKDKAGEVSRISYDEFYDKVKPNDMVLCRTKAPILKAIFRFIELSVPIDVHQDDLNLLISELKKLFKKEELEITELNNPLFWDDVRSRNIYFIEKDAERIIDETIKSSFISEELELLEVKIKFIKDISFSIEQWKDLKDLLENIFNLFQSETDAVKLSTIHKAKGLENNTVFILNYDKLPLYRPDQTDWEEVQEKNLKYVAITRSKKDLILVDSPEAENRANISLFEALENDL